MKAYFFVVCILARFTLALVIPHVPYFLGILPIGVGVGFLYHMTLKDHDRGYFGGRVWWASYRWVHAILYIAAGISLLYHAPKYAGRFLSVDVGFAIGFGFWEWLFPTVRTARPSPLPTSAP